MYKHNSENGRFAPSPSGQLHMGNLASFLLNAVKNTTWFLIFC